VRKVGRPQPQNAPAGRSAPDRRRPSGASRHRYSYGPPGGSGTNAIRRGTRSAQATGATRIRSGCSFGTGAGLNHAQASQREQPKAAGLRLKRSRRCGGRFAPAPAVWTTAPGLLLFCLQPAGNLANDGADRPVGGAEVCIAGADGQRWPRRSARLLLSRLASYLDLVVVGHRLCCSERFGVSSRSG
jgi:hypothetical protein